MKNRGNHSLAVPLPGAPGSRKFLPALTKGLLLWLIFITASTFAAAKFYYKGFVDTYHTVRIKEPNDFLISRTRLRLEMTKKQGKASAFVSVEFEQNNISPARTGLKLREAYLRYDSNKWDLKIGRQIIIWGKADGIPITDLISPFDLSEFLARDYEDIYLPVDAARIRLLGNKFNFEFVWVPIFRPAIFPGPGEPWAPPLDDIQGMNLVVKPPLEPGKKIGNSELFGKMSFYLAGFDFAFSAFTTWDDFGITRFSIMQSPGTPSAIEMQTEYYRVKGIGAEFSTTLGGLVFRGEAAFLKGKRYQAENFTDGIFKKNSILWLLGLDWFGGNDWIITGQLADEMILEHESAIQKHEHNFIVTLSIEKKLMNQILSVSNMTYWGLNEQEYFNRIKIDYAFTDSLHLILGADLIGGAKGKGLFGQYKDNKQIFFKVKYSF